MESYTVQCYYIALNNRSEANVKKVLEACGVKPEEGRVKALVGALKAWYRCSNKRREQQSFIAAAPVSSAAKKEEKKKKKNDEEAAAGLAGLFG